MSLFEQFATNRKAETEGVEVTFGSKNADGTIPTFRIARMSKTNKRYQKMLEVETKPYAHAIRNDTLSADVDEAIMLKIFLATVLLGWSNLVEPRIFGTEQAAPYTPENGEKLMKALPELYNTLKQQASSLALFRSSDIEEDSKN